MYIPVVYGYTCLDEFLRAMKIKYNTPVSYLEYIGIYIYMYLTL